MKRTEFFIELLHLAELTIIGEATKTDSDRLNEILVGNIEAQRFYLDYMHLHTLLLADRLLDTVIVKGSSLVETAPIRSIDIYSDLKLANNT